MNLMTILQCARSKDKELRLKARKQLMEFYGSDVTTIIIGILDQTIRLEEYETEIKRFIHEEVADKIIECLREALTTEPTLNMAMIMELYHSGDEFYRNKAVEMNLEKNGRFISYLIQHTCPTFAKQYHDDMYQRGVIGLLKAMARYKPENGNFLTYSRPFIVHELSAEVQYLEQSAATPHYMNLQAKISNAMNQLECLGEEVTPERVAILAEVNVRIAQREMNIIKSQDFLYLDALEDIDEYPMSRSTPSPEMDVLRKETQGILIDALTKLPELWRTIILLKDVEGYTFVKISKETGLTKSQVITRYQKGIDALRELLDPKEWIS